MGKWKKVLAVLLSALMVLLMIPFAPTTAVLAEEDYRSWSQSDPRWGGLIMGDDPEATVATYGCTSLSVTKLLRQSGVVGADYTPYNFADV